MTDLETVAVGNCGTSNLAIIAEAGELEGECAIGALKARVWIDGRAVIAKDGGRFEVAVVEWELAIVEWVYDLENEGISALWKVLVRVCINGAVIVEDGSGPRFAATFGLLAESTCLGCWREVARDGGGPNSEATSGSLLCVADVNQVFCVGEGAGHDTDVADVGRAGKLLSPVVAVYFELDSMWGGFG